MQIVLKNKDTLLFGEFKFKCSIGKGITSKNFEGDKKTPRVNISLGPTDYRKDKFSKLDTKLKKILIKKDMGWCDDVNSKYYNKQIKINNKIKHEKMFRKDKMYDLLLPINYNSKKPVKNKGSAIFIHITKNYKKTLGCISIKEKDFLVLLKVINKKTKIKIL